MCVISASCHHLTSPSLPPSCFNFFPFPLFPLHFFTGLLLCQSGTYASQCVGQPGHGGSNGLRACPLPLRLHPGRFKSLPHDAFWREETHIEKLMSVPGGYVSAKSSLLSLSLPLVILRFIPPVSVCTLVNVLYSPPPPPPPELVAPLCGAGCLVCGAGASVSVPRGTRRR